MKKILSVMLAVMMLFGALSISASAANVPPAEVVNPVINSQDQVVIVFKFFGGSSKNPLPVYYSDVVENGGFVNEIVTGDYYLLPGAGGVTLRTGTSINLPSVTPPEGKHFVGWDSSVDAQDLVAGATYEISDVRVRTSKEFPNNGIIYMEAMYEAAEPEEDTMATVLGILMKVFGTIIGILFLDGSSAAGIELMEKVLGGIL